MRRTTYWSRSDLAAVFGRTTARSPWLQRIRGPGAGSGHLTPAATPEGTIVVGGVR